MPSPIWRYHPCSCDPTHHVIVDYRNHIMGVDNMLCTRCASEWDQPKPLNPRASQLVAWSRQAWTAFHAD
mgnify:FL=1